MEFQITGKTQGDRHRRENYKHFKDRKIDNNILAAFVSLALMCLRIHPLVYYPPTDYIVILWVLSLSQVYATQ